MKDLLTRTQVVLAAAVTWINATVVVLTAAAAEFPTVAAWVTRIIAWLISAVAIISRVTPVAPDDRGLLPK